MDIFFLVMAILFVLLFFVSLIMLIVNKSRKRDTNKNQVMIALSLFGFILSTVSAVLLLGFDGSSKYVFAGWFVLFSISLLMARTGYKARKRMKELNAKNMMTGFHADGLSIPEGTTTRIICNDELLIMESDKQKFEIPLNRVTNYAKLTEKEIIQQNKSVVGRAVVGGVFLGGLGAVIGGMSGIGQKVKNKNNSFFVINYEDKEGETKAVSFLTNLNVDYFIDEFTNTLNKFKGNGDQEDTVTL